MNEGEIRLLKHALKSLRPHGKIDYISCLIEKSKQASRLEILSKIEMCDSDKHDDGTIFYRVDKKLIDNLKSKGVTE